MTRTLTFLRHTVVFGIAACCASLLAQTQEQPTTPCVLAQGQYSCNAAELKSTVDAAKTFSVRTSPRDRVGASQMRSLGAALGKSFALANQPADLSFELFGVETGGVNYGSMDRALATLKVYTRSQDIVWVETFSGQPDLPWAAVVSRLVEQFRTRLK